MMDRLLDVLGIYMRLREERNAILASNIANAETPGYKARDLVFEDQLREALNIKEGDDLKLHRTHPRHLPQNPSLGDVDGRVVYSKTGVARFDGNTVDIDREMTKLSENALLYNAAVQMLIKKIDILKTALREVR